MTSTMQAMLHCDVPGLTILEYSDDGVVWVALTAITGWKPFKDWLQELSVLLDAAADWYLSYSPTTDVITCTKRIGGLTPLYLRVESQSMADCLGMADLETAGDSSTFTLGTSPLAVVPLLSCDFGAPTPAKSVNSQLWRHGRARSVGWGSGFVYRASIMALYASAERLSSGPAMAGKVRLGPWAATDPYASDELGGYLDGHIVETRPPEMVDDYMQMASIDVTLLVSTDAHDPDETLLTPVTYGSLKRGYSWVCYARIQGIPYIFTEHTTGIAATSGYTLADGLLVIDDVTSIRTELSRENGIAGVSDIRLSILDPLNTLGLFKRPSLTAQIDEEVEADPSAEIGITVDDTTGWGASGGFFLGLEYIQYSSKTGTVFTLNTGTRGTWGPTYQLTRYGGHRFTTISDVPIAWHGRIVELWAMLVDPFGRPVGTDWDDDYCSQLYVGQVDGVPGYDSGLRVLSIRALLRRLATDIGVAASAQTAPYAVEGDVGSAWVYVAEGQLLQVQADFILNVLVDTTVTAELDVLQILIDAGDVAGGSTEAVVQYRTAISRVLDAVNAIDDGSGNLVGETLAVSLHDIRIEGSLLIVTIRRAYWVGTAGTPYDDVRVKLSVSSQSPYWATPAEWQAVQFAAVNPGGALSYLVDVVGMDGTTAGAVAIQEAGDVTQSALDSSGLAVVGEESIEYEGKFGIDGDLLHILTGVTRRKNQASVSVLDVGLDVRQVYSANSNESDGAGTILATLLESSGTGLRGTYDSLGRGFGYGLSDDYVLDTAVVPGLRTLDDSIGLKLTLAEPQSVETLFGGYLTARGVALAPVRVGALLKIGVAVWQPLGATTDDTLRDTDLALERAAEMIRVSAGPNIVRINRADTADGETELSATFRLLEDMDASGGRQFEADLYGVDAAFFPALAEVLALGLLNRGDSLNAYRLRVAPWHDWQVGQLLDVDLSHHGIWDWHNDTTGLLGFGRIVGTSRNIKTGECEIELLSDGSSLTGALCPAPVVTSFILAGEVLNVSAGSRFVAGMHVYLYRPGVDGTEEKAEIDSVDGNEITLTGAPATAPTANETLITYIDDDDGDITSLQDAHVHDDDGSVFT